MDVSTAPFPSSCKASVSSTAAMPVTTVKMFESSGAIVESTTAMHESTIFLLMMPPVP